MSVIVTWTPVQEVHVISVAVTSEAEALRNIFGHGNIDKIELSRTDELTLEAMHIAGGRLDDLYLGLLAALLLHERIIVSIDW